jgi:hypothetical protein
MKRITFKEKTEEESIKEAEIRITRITKIIEPERNYF